MTFAFSPNVPVKAVNVSRKGCTTMCARTPGDSTAAASKFASFIDSTRLNKAPVININAFPNEEYNYFTVDMVTLRSETYAAASLPDPVGHDPKEFSNETREKWEQYYNPETVNQAPYISIIDGKSDENRGVGVVFVDTPLQVNVPQAIRDSILFPVNTAVKDYTSLPPDLVGENSAPEIVINDNNDPWGSDGVSVSMVPQPLNLYTANAILNKYKPA